METEIIQEKDIDRAAKYLKEGELVAFPTETVYGLGAPVFNDVAIKEIFRVKGRPADNPLIVHISKLEQVEMVARELPDLFFLLAEKFFPGPLTLVVRKNKSIPDIVSGGLDTVAIRMPNHRIAKKLIEAVGSPLVAPSANLSGKPSSTSADHVMNDFAGVIPAILDGGPCILGVESTVVDLVSFAKPTLLRLGALPKEEIEKFVELEIYYSGPKSSPGMKYRHYAPNIPVRKFQDRNAFEKYIQESKKPYILTDIQLKKEHLYAELRFAELEGYEEVVIFSEKALDPVVENRLEKITSGFHSS